MMSQRITRWLYYAATLPLWWAAYYTANIFIIRISKAMGDLGLLDFPVFIQYAHQFIANGHLYNENLALYGPGEPIYKFPPLMGAILVNLLQRGVSEETIFFWAGTGEVVAFCAATIICILALPKMRAWISVPITLALACAYAPLLEDNLLRLQPEPFFITCARYCPLLHATTT